MSPKGQKISARPWIRVSENSNFPVPYSELHMVSLLEAAVPAVNTVPDMNISLENRLCCVADLFSGMTCWPHRDGEPVTFQLVWVMKDRSAPCHIPIGKWEVPINQHAQINTRCAANVGNERQNPSVGPAKQQRRISALPDRRLRMQCLANCNMFCLLTSSGAEVKNASVLCGD
jgi:hypothetical protein